MSDDGKVVHLADVSRGHTPPDLRAWAQGWLEHESLDPGAVRSVVIVVERFDGTPTCIAQSIAPLDGVRLVGLLQHVIHRLLHGKGLGL